MIKNSGGLSFFTLVVIAVSMVAAIYVTSEVLETSFLPVLFALWMRASVHIAATIMYFASVLGVYLLLGAILKKIGIPLYDPFPLFDRIMSR